LVQVLALEQELELELELELEQELEEGAVVLDTFY
jgi:hypothetical protein